MLITWAIIRRCHQRINKREREKEIVQKRSRPPIIDNERTGGSIGVFRLVDTLELYTDTRKFAERDLRGI